MAALVPTTLLAPSAPIATTAARAHSCPRHRPLHPLRCRPISHCLQLSRLRRLLFHRHPLRRTARRRVYRPLFQRAAKLRAAHQSHHPSLHQRRRHRRHRHRRRHPHRRHHFQTCQRAIRRVAPARAVPSTAVSRAASFLACSDATVPVVASMCLFRLRPCSHRRPRGHPRWIPHPTLHHRCRLSYHHPRRRAHTHQVRSCPHSFLTSRRHSAIATAHRTAAGVS